MPEQAGAVDVRVLGGPTTLIEIGGLRLLTDPTFDPAQDYELAPGLVMTKTTDAPVDPSSLGPIDAVLLSHDQHPDNLDRSGRAFVADAPDVLTTPSAALNLGRPARGLYPWDAAVLRRPNGSTLTVTAVPAQHGPAGCEPVTGAVTGFVLSGEGVPTVYVSGDNASLSIVEEIAFRVPSVDTAVIFAGAARTPFFDGALVTLDSVQAAEAVRILGARRAVVAHTDSWSHYTEDRAAVERAFAAAGMADRLQRLSKSPVCPTEDPSDAVLVTRVTPADWQRYRDVRLAALAESPEMFGSTLAKEQDFDEAEWRRRAARPATFLASRDGVDIGLAGMYEVDGSWHVMGMWITPVARGTGVVEALVDACESVAQNTGATAVALGVMEDNPRGRKAYVRLGYAFTGAREQVRDGRDELLMTKALPSSPLSS